MKTILLIFILSCCVSWTSAQSTYNYRLDFDRPTSSVLGSIEVTDSCFYVCGVANDSLPPFQLGSIFAKISFEGEVIWYKTLVDSIEYFGTWYNTLEKDNENFMVSGTYFDTLGRADLLIKYNADGDTLFTRKYRSPYLPDNGFIALINSIKAPDDGYYMISNITNTINSNTDIYLKKVNSLGQFDWGVVYGENQNSEAVGGMLIEEDKIIFGGHINNINFSNQDYFSRAFLVQTNLEGEVEWEYESPVGELRNRVSDILKTDDGGYLLASGKGIEFGQLPGTFLYWQPYVFKLDADRNFEWGVSIRDSLFHSSNVINKMVEISDGSGYVVAGRSYRPNPLENGYDYLGLVAKISKEGDSLWTRRYNHIQSAAENHIFYDLEETPDGGFVMVGQAADFNQLTGDLPLQRAWIVKVDQHGCLVPGCHLTSPTVELQEASFEIKTYPNPATDYLNVYFQHPMLKETAYFSLVDVSGKTALEFQSRHGDITHMIPVGGLPSGIYWLRCRVGEEILTKEIVVQ